jgi:muramoyltetrapeptide carboxypeptidase
MIYPSSLRHGDKVAFIAPARKVVLEELEKASLIFASWGLEVVCPLGLFLEDNQFAGTDTERIIHIQWCLDNPEIRAVFCVRGGYGTSRIIDGLDFSKFKQNPSWLIGFSDVTVLLNTVYNQGVASVHGPIALLLHQNASVQKHLKSILFDSNFSNNLKVPFHPFNQFGCVKGKLIGGNLSVLVNQIGTNSFPDLDGGILFLEDLDEYLYHIDRMMVQLDRFGVFQQISGLVIGYMSGMHDNEIPFGNSAYGIIASVVNKYDLPIAFGLPVGHEENNQPIVVGKTMLLEITEEGTRLGNNSCG